MYNKHEGVYVDRFIQTDCRAIGGSAHGAGNRQFHALRLLPLHAIGDIGMALNRMDMRKQAKFGGGDASPYYNAYKKYYAA